MTGYQQHASLETAGIVDYVPNPLGLDMTNVRESDKAADAKWKE
jgi:hypothetical protein